MEESIKQFKFQYYFSKIAIGFFTTLYLLAGLGMLVISFIIEAKVFLTMLGESPFVSYLTAACIEASKLGTVIVYDFVERKNSTAIQKNTSIDKIKFIMQLLFKRGFQLSLFVISMLCILTVISEQFDRPNIDKIKALELSNIDVNYQRSRIELLEQHQAEKKDLIDQQLLQGKSIEDRYNPLINQATNGMEIERHKPDNRGNVRGKRYKSYEALLENHQVNLQNELNSHQTFSTQKTQEQNLRHSKDLKQLSEGYSKEKNSTQQKDYEDDERVEHKSIRAIVDTLNHVLSVFNFQPTLTPISFVAIFSLILAIIIESGIFLSLSSFVAIFFPNEFSSIEVEMEASQKKTIKNGLNPETT